MLISVNFALTFFYILCDREEHLIFANEFALNSP
jgi:hypothetical protein